MTTSDMISGLCGSGENLTRFDYTIVKHWDVDKCEERIYLPDFDSFVRHVFDLDIYGWELSGFNKSKYPKYSFFAGNICAEFSQRGY